MQFHKLLLLLSTTVLLAQTPPKPPGPPPEPRADEVKAALGLSDELVNQLVQLRREQREALRLISQQMREKQRTLRESLQAGSADANALGTLLLDIQNLRKQIQDTRDRFHTQALGLLNDEQKAKLAGLEEAMKLRPAITQATALNLLKPPPPQRLEGLAAGQRLGEPGAGLMRLRNRLRR